VDDPAIIFSERLTLLIISLILGGCISLVGWRNGFYHIPAYDERQNNIAGALVFKAFAIFFGIWLLFVPALYHLFDLFVQNPELDLALRTWMNLIGVIIAAVCFWFFFRSLTVGEKQAVMGAKWKKHPLFTCLIGCSIWFVAYPWVIATGQLIEIIFHLLGVKPHADQLAVQHLKDIIDKPWLFFPMATAVILIIPFLEELLFRGFIQTWLKPLIGRKSAILLSSVIFACFHFSSEQKIGNVELLVSLFVFSCYLGFVKEKLESLWGSVALHSTFNCISILVLILFS